jgi:hypothetical protein
MARMLTQAALTGAFCLVLALAVDTVTDTLAVGAFLAVSFASGGLGSLFALTAPRRGRPEAGEAE